MATGGNIGLTSGLEDFFSGIIDTIDDKLASANGYLAQEWHNLTGIDPITLRKDLYFLSFGSFIHSGMKDGDIFSYGLSICALADGLFLWQVCEPDDSGSGSKYNAFINNNIKMFRVGIYATFALTSLVEIGNYVNTCIEGNGSDYAFPSLLSFSLGMLLSITADYIGKSEYHCKIFEEEMERPYKI